MIAEEIQLCYFSRQIEYRFFTDELRMSRDSEFVGVIGNFKIDVSGKHILHIR